MRYRWIEITERGDKFIARFAEKILHKCYFGAKKNSSARKGNGKIKWEEIHRRERAVLELRTSSKNAKPKGARTGAKTHRAKDNTLLGWTGGIRVAGRRERGWRTAWRRHGEHGVVEVASAPGRQHRVTTINTCTRCCAGAKDVEFEKCYSARLSLNDMEGNASPRGCHVCASAPRLLRACTRLSDFVWPAPKHGDRPASSLYSSVLRLSPLSPRFSSGHCRRPRAPSRHARHPIIWHSSFFKNGQIECSIVGFLKSSKGIQKEDWEGGDGGRVAEFLQYRARAFYEDVAAR